MCICGGSTGEVYANRLNSCEEIHKRGVFQFILFHLFDLQEMSVKMPVLIFILRLKLGILFDLSVKSSRKNVIMKENRTKSSLRSLMGFCVLLCL